MDFLVEIALKVEKQGHQKVQIVDPVPLFVNGDDFIGQRILIC